MKQDTGQMSASQQGLRKAPPYQLVPQWVAAKASQGFCRTISLDIGLVCPIQHWDMHGSDRQDNPSSPVTWPLPLLPYSGCCE